MAVDDLDALGWRERKKLATRDAIGSAALRLALQIGPENVRVEDIAAAAGVSSRTFNNYFSSREEAICAMRVERSRRVADALRRRPAQEPLAEALIAAITEASTDGEPDKACIRLVAATPAMRGEYMRGIVQLETGLAEAIAERTGADLGRDPAPRVIAAAFTAALRVASEYWLRSDDDMPFTEFLRHALAVLAPVARGHPPAASPPDHLPANPFRESSAC